MPKQAVLLKQYKPLPKTNFQRILKENTSKPHLNRSFKETHVCKPFRRQKKNSKILWIHEISINLTFISYFSLISFWEKAKRRNCASLFFICIASLCKGNRISFAKMIANQIDPCLRVAFKWFIEKSMYLVERLPTRSYWFFCQELEALEIGIT